MFSPKNYTHNKVYIIVTTAKYWLSIFVLFSPKNENRFYSKRFYINKWMLIDSSWKMQFQDKRKQRNLYCIQNFSLFIFEIWCYSYFFEKSEQSHIYSVHRHLLAATWNHWYWCLNLIFAWAFFLFWARFNEEFLDDWSWDLDDFLLNNDWFLGNSHFRWNSLTSSWTWNNNWWWFDNNWWSTIECIAFCFTIDD